jgi:hypothetical protein
VVGTAFGTAEVRESAVLAFEPMGDIDAWLESQLANYVGDDCEYIGSDMGEGDCVKEKHEMPPMTGDEREFLDLVGSIVAAFAASYNLNGGNYAKDRGAWVDVCALDNMRGEVVRMGVEGTVEFLRKNPRYLGWDNCAKSIMEGTGV